MTPVGPFWRGVHDDTFSNSIRVDQLETYDTDEDADDSDSISDLHFTDDLIGSKNDFL